MRALFRILSSAAAVLITACGASPQSPTTSSAATAEAECRTPPTPTTLAEAGRLEPGHRVLVGTALEYGALTTDASYAAIAAKEFDLVTPGNETKWGSLQSAPGVWNFAQADAIYAFAGAHHQKVKGHTLVWHQQLPAFVNDDLPAADLDQALAAHIRKVVGRYQGRTWAWDVVNEAVADDGSGLRDTVFLRKLGPDYIARAFWRARLADWDAQLLYNDYGAETINAKSDAVLALVTDLVKRHVPIDGVGFQMHLEAQNAPTKEELKANFERFTRLGLQVNVSELDVRVTKVPGSLARKLAFQKEIYNRVAAACVETKHCRALTSWGFTDAHSWIHSTFGPDWPLQFDGNYQKKPAYDGEFLGLQGQLVPSPGSVENLVANPSFEAGLEGWTSWGGTLAVSAAAAHQGAQSAVLTGRTAGWQGPVYPLTSLVQTGYSYTASAWARIASTDPLSLTAKIVCDGQEQYVNVATVNGNPGQWVVLTGSLSVPQCTVLGELDLYVNGPPAGVDVMVDDVFVGDEQAAFGPNLVANGDFEAGVSGWSTWGAALSQSALQAHGGLFSALVSNRSATYLGPVYWIGSLMSPGHKYAVSAWARLGAGGNQGVNFTAQINCSGGAMYQQMASAQVGSAGWTPVSATFSVPACAAGTLQGINVYLEGPAAGTDLFVDDVSIRQVVSSNLIANPGFESGVTGWSTWGAAISASTLRAHSGAQGGLVTSRTATWQGAVYDLTSQVAPGTTYEASIWAMIGAGADQPVNFTAKITCDGADSYNWIGSATASSSSWTKIAGSFTIPACTTLGSVVVYAEGPAAGVDLFVDDALVR